MGNLSYLVFVIVLKTQDISKNIKREEKDTTYSPNATECKLSVWGESKMGTGWHMIFF